jgi:dynein heavy chain
MNPEYAGRTELLASVKALFRPVVCIAPDLEIIGFTVLLCEGFLQAKVSTLYTVLVSAFHFTTKYLSSVRCFTQSVL